ncbi:MAG: nucleoside phosphorylase [Deltaproteobacteria bacterium]|nr:nucleoside phosphorylase [Deltaproteobacteria bacterium]
MTTTFQSAEIVATAEGQQYHIGCKPGDVAPYILLCGDPARAHRTAEYFSDRRPPITYREYVTITGTYNGIPISVMATGIGTDNTEIAFVELFQIVKQPTLIRIGTSGGLKKGMGIGDLVISSGAVRMENTSTGFVVEGYPAVAHHECVLALLEAAHQKKFAHHLGLTASTSGFYGAQGRRVPGIMPRDPEIPAKLDAMNVVNFEMEASCLFTLGALTNIRTGCVCAAINNRHQNVFIDSDGLKKAEKRCIETGLGAIEVLAAMDRARGSSPHWLPSMGL